MCIQRRAGIHVYIYMYMYTCIYLGLSVPGLAVHEVLVQGTVAMTERVGSEWVNLQLVRETVIPLVQIPVTGNEETGL